MRRCFSLLLICVLLFLPVNASVSGDTVVYVTTYGEKYHRGNCSYLRQSKIEMTIEDAVKAGYTPCSRCHPGRWQGTPEKQEATSKTTQNRLKTAPNRLDRILFLIMKITIFSIPVFFVSAIIVLLHRRSVRERQEKERREAFLNELRKEVASYIGLSKNEIASSCGMPSDVYIGKDGFPHSKNSETDSWTVYISRTGNCYHARKDCGGSPLIAFNFVEVPDYCLRPCLRCWHRSIPKTTWYSQYHRILTVLNTLNIPPDND